MSYEPYPGYDSIQDIMFTCMKRKQVRKTTTNLMLLNDKVTQPTHTANFQLQRDRTYANKHPNFVMNTKTTA